MPDPKSIGEVTGTTINFEWTITNFRACAKKKANWSPYFPAGDVDWSLRVDNGRKVKNNKEYVSLYLLAQYDVMKAMVVYFELGIKTVHGAIVNIRKGDYITDGIRENGFDHFISKSDLEARESEMMPSGNLTFTCSIQIKNCSTNSTASKKQLTADLMDMLNSGRSADVTIKVKEGNFPAHWFILTARSPVFRAMYENEMCERESGLINISDCEPGIFSQFLRYLYSAELGTECNFFQLYELADKYQVDELKTVCAKCILLNFSIDSFCQTYAFGYRFNDKVLVEGLQRIFYKNFAQIVATGSWLAFMKEDSDTANTLLKAMAPKMNNVIIRRR